MARAAKDLDLAALQELVGTDGQMAVEISRNVSVTPGRDDFEHIATWTISQDDVNAGTLYENLRRFSGGCDGTGSYHFKATKPGVRAKPVEWEMRLPGAPRAPAHVQAEDAAKRQQQAATGQAAWPPGPGQIPPGGAPGAPITQYPIGGGAPQGYGVYPGMSMMGPWGMGMPPFGYGFGPMPATPVSPAQPAGPLGDLGALLKPLIERLVQAPAPAAPARDPEIDKLREEATRAREAEAKRDAEWQRRFDASEATRREEKAAADLKLSEERARSEAATRQAETDRRFAEAKVEADRRHETLLAALTAAREEGGGKSKTSETVEAFKLMFQQQAANATEQREILMKMLDSAQNQDPYPEWMVSMFKEKSNGPKELEAMTGAYARLFEMTSSLTQAQIATIMDKVGDNNSPVVGALMSVFEKLGNIGEAAMARRAQPAAQPLAGAQAPRQLPSQNGANGTRDTAPAPASGRAAQTAEDFGALTEAIGNLRQAQIKGMPIDEAAARIVEVIDFGDGFALSGSAPLIELIQKDVPALVGKMLPGAPSDYQAKVVDAIKAILAESAKTGAGGQGAAPAAADPVAPVEPPAN